MDKNFDHNMTDKSFLPKIPKHWSIKKAKFIFKNIDERSKKGTEQLLSVSAKQGVIPRQQVNVTMFMAESYVGYKLCKKKDLVINSLWAWSNGLGFSEHEGIVSTAYGVFRFYKKNDFDCGYYNFLLRTSLYNGLYFINSKGIWISRLMLSGNTFLNLPIIVPPLHEQKKIAKYLNYKTKQANKFIENKTRLVELFKEQKKAIINKAVTKGINPDAAMKDSGIEWLGEIPAHWDVRKLKYLAFVNPSSIDKKSRSNESEILLCNYVDVYNNDFITNKINFMKATATKEQIKKFLLQKDDVILTKDSETPDDIGVPALVDESFEKVVCGYHLTHVKPKKILGSYLFWQFQCKFQQSYFEISANGVTRYGVRFRIEEVYGFIEVFYAFSHYLYYSVFFYFVVESDEKCAFSFFFYGSCGCSLGIFDEFQ